MAIQNMSYGAWVALAVTNLQSLANDASDPFAAWQSERVDNRTVLAMDYEVHVKLPTAATAPANSQAAFIYGIPWVHNGTVWVPGANFGTTALPTGTEGTASVSDPNSMKGPFAAPYKITSQQLDLMFFVSELFALVPDGWSLAIRNATGAALSTGCVVEYRPITFTIV